MFHLNEDFKSVLSPAKWRNKVSAFLNNICGDGVTYVHKPENPNSGNPPVIKIKIPELIAKLKEAGFGGGNEPLAVRTVMSTGTSPHVTSVQVCLPATSITLSGVECSITGLPTTHDGDWYQVATAAGTLWLVVSSTTAKGVTTYSAAFQMPSTEPTTGIPYKVAVIGTDGTVTQFPSPRTGVLTDNSGLRGTAGTNPKFRTNDGATDTATDTSVMHNDGVPTGSKFPASKYGLKTDEWRLGESRNGSRLLVVSRIEVDDEADPAEHYLYFRCETRDATGRTIHIGPEIGCAKILA